MPTDENAFRSLEQKFIILKDPFDKKKKYNKQKFHRPLKLEPLPSIKLVVGWLIFNLLFLVFDLLVCLVYQHLQFWFIAHLVGLAFCGVVWKYTIKEREKVRERNFKKWLNYEYPPLP